MIKKLLSLPPNVVDSFHEVTGLSRDEYFCTCDPIGHRLGSGGGTTWVLQQAEKWLQGERCVILHAGGQSKRLPSYAVSGKVLTPIPVFRWERGQRLSQTLMDLQLPLYERMMEQAPQSLTTMIVSGDVYIRAAERIGEIPEADVVCYGLWLDASIAKNHGVFVSDRRTPNVLKQMLQKPSTETLTELLKDHFYLTDIGIWMLSDKAVRLLKQKSMDAGAVIRWRILSLWHVARDDQFDGSHSEYRQRPARHYAQRPQTASEYFYAKYHYALSVYGREFQHLDREQLCGAALDTDT